MSVFVFTLAVGVSRLFKFTAEYFCITIQLYSSQILSDAPPVFQRKTAMSDNKNLSRFPSNPLAPAPILGYN